MFVITGGGSGIGKSLALALIERGKEVLIIGRRESLLQTLAETSPLLHFLCADVALKSGRDAIVDYLKDFPQVEGLVHNAATINPIARLGDISEDDWRESMATNVDAPLFLTQDLKDKLTNGRVLHIGSGAAYFAIAGWSAYCVSKAALSMITKCWQLEGSLNVSSVMPGIVKTSLLKHACSYTAQMDSDKLEFFNELETSNKMLEPSTVSDFLSWLLLDITNDDFISQEWDIYDISHHQYWLKDPHFVPQLEGK